jgi:hypothetical protein
MDNQSLPPEAIEFAGLQRMNYQRLPWEEKLTIMWSWFWRSLIVTLGTSMIAGFVLGFFIVLATFLQKNLNPSAIMFVGFVLGGGVSMATIHPLIGWITSSRIGQYRIIICRTRTDESITPANPEPDRIIAF